MRKNLLFASPLASGGLMVIFDIPWLVKDERDLWLHWYMTFSLCSCPSPVFSFYEDTNPVGSGD